MRGGEIVEQGTPQKIYFDADHQFVADFIGRANLVKATVLAQEADRTVVGCALGTIVCQRRDVAVGADVTLCIRPEFIRIGRGGAAPGTNAISARIDSLTFVGEVYEAEIRAGGALLLARIDPDATLAEGDAVAFSLDPAHCLLVSS
jgi:iron(III) transport system ATP-binding protein